MKKRSIILIGGGGHCKSCIDLILATEKFSIAGIVDAKENVGKEILGFSIIATDDDLENLVKKYDSFAITVGQIKSAETRVKIYNRLKNIEAETPSIIAPSAYVSPSAKIGVATMIFHKVLINAEASVGDNCIVNNCALIEHETIVESHCHISTAAVLNGDVTVGEGAFIGSNAVVRQGITVGEYAVVGAGSTVIKNVAARMTVAGSPAIVIGKNE